MELNGTFAPWNFRSPEQKKVELSLLTQEFKHYRSTHLIEADEIKGRQHTV